MIHVDFSDDSRAELRLLVKSPPCDAIPPNADKASDLLFSALRGRLRELLPALDTPPVEAAALPTESSRPAPRAMSSVDRQRNPLYNMFSQQPVSAVI